MSTCIILFVARRPTGDNVLREVKRGGAENKPWRRCCPASFSIRPLENFIVLPPSTSVFNPGAYMRDVHAISTVCIGLEYLNLELCILQLCEARPGFTPNNSDNAKFHFCADGWIYTQSVSANRDTCASGECSIGNKVEPLVDWKQAARGQVFHRLLATSVATGQSLGCFSTMSIVTAQWLAPLLVRLHQPLCDLGYNT